MEVDYDISTFEPHALVLTRAHSSRHKTYEDQETPEEEVDLCDVWDELRYQYRVKNLDNTPLAIKVTNIPDAPIIDAFFEESLPRKDLGTRLFVETEDGVLRRVSPDDSENIQIFMPEVRCPRLPNFPNQ